MVKKMIRIKYKGGREARVAQLTTHRKKKSGLTVARSIQPIPQRYIVKMKYAENFTPGNSSGQCPWRINLNSIFDPNRTGTGHQPYAHDTFQTLYNRYRVIKCSYRITAISSTGVPIQVAALPANEEFAATSLADYRENPRAKYMVQGVGAPIKFLSGNVNLPSLTGRTKSQYMADDRYQAQFGSSPPELMVLNINSQAMDETLLVTTGTTYQLTLVYTVECFDPKNLIQS